MDAVRYFWAHQRIPFISLIALTIALLWFGTRFLLEFIYFNDPAHKNQSLEAWMTPRYVSLSYQVPPEKLMALMEIESRAGPSPSIGDVAERLGITLEELEARVIAAKTALDLERESRQPVKKDGIVD